jgi:predicted membrane protein
MNAKNDSKFLPGLILILLGIFFLLRNYNFFDFYIPDFVRSWEFFFIAFGVIIIAATRNVVAGSIFIFIGLINWTPDLWPLILVIIGIAIILKRNNSKPSKGLNDSPNSSSGTDDRININSIFGGGTNFVNSKNFQGGKITCIFGGAEVYLNNAQLAEGNSDIEINIIFGGTTIYIPNDWHVETKVTALFGGFDQKRLGKFDDTLDKSKTLTIHGFVMFGGGELKSVL